MNDDDPQASELKARFEALRAAEEGSAPSFARTLAAARARGPRPAVSFRLPAAAAAALAALALLLLVRTKPEAPDASLSEAIPVLLPHSPASAHLFAASPFAGSRLPSDTVLPPSLRLSF